jgi:RND family efflux transporter MFP subunit
MSTKPSRSAFLGLRFAGVFLLAFLTSPIRADDPKGEPVVFEAAGYVVPCRLVTVSSKVSGQLIQINLEEGKFVKKGEVLARLEDTEFRTKLDAAKAELLIATTQLLKTKAEGKEEDVIIAEARVALARAKMQQAQVQLNATIIVAPISGTILTKKTEVGNVVNPRAFNLSPSICEMADLRELEVTIDVSERDISRLAKGQACLIQLDAFPKTTYKGQVARILPVADRAKGTFPVRVKIAVPDKDTQLKPEMHALVKFLGGDA